jgi:secondary thiamine-phosphate synthase enzyme
MRTEFTIPTSKSIQLTEITREVQKAVSDSGVSDGYCVVFCPHTTAGLVINEAADPDVATDMENAFEVAVPNIPFRHMEGNSPSHFLSCMTGSSLHLLVSDSRIELGRWQGIFFCEFDGPRRRRVTVRTFPA